MSFASVPLTPVILASQVQQPLAPNPMHADYLEWIATYTPMAGFNHAVGTTGFVGYFLQSPNACKLTVFEAAAYGEALTSSPRRIDIDIPAADRSEFGAGDGSALAIFCAADADAIKIAPQNRATVSVAPANELSR